MAATVDMGFHKRIRPTRRAAPPMITPSTVNTQVKLNTTGLSTQQNAARTNAYTTIAQWLTRTRSVDVVFGR
jgi:hypothetical protein